MAVRKETAGGAIEGRIKCLGWRIEPWRWTRWDVGRCSRIWGPRESRPDEKRGLYRVARDLGIRLRRHSLPRAIQGHCDQRSVGFATTRIAKVVGAIVGVTVGA
jgi:hypothetical protein